MAKFLNEKGRYSGSKRLDAKAMNLKEPDADNDYTRDIWLESGEVQEDPDFHEEIKEKIDAWKKAISIVTDPSKIIVHTVGESHIDCAWLWRYEQTRQKAAKTFKKACIHAKMFPNKFNFALSEPLLLEWVKEDEPELFKEIQETVKNGGIEIVGGSYVEPDCMMPSGEAFCRMRLYGMRFIRENFGVENLPEVEWFLDSFGYNWGIPQILAKSGAKYFWTSKITWNLDTIFPFVNFWWEGPDGSRILTANFQMGPGPLDNWMKFEIGRHLLKSDGQKVWDYTYNYEDIADHVEDEEICPHVGNFFGKGDGGHGPTHQEVAVNNEYCENGMFKWSKVHDFYRSLDEYSDRFPIWKDELYLENHRGTFSVHAEVKRHNRKNENYLTSFETLALIASIVNPNYKYPFDTFEWGWKTTLKNQFHDTLPGSSIPEVYDDTWDDWCAQEESYEQITSNVGIMLGSKKELKDDTCDIFLFNPVAWERKNRVFIPLSVFKNEISLDKSGKPNYAKLVSIDGDEEYICQPIAAEPENTIERMEAGWWVVPLLKAASTTPFRMNILSDEDTKKIRNQNKIIVEKLSISNDFNHIKIDEKTGAILELKSKEINNNENILKGNESNLTFAWKDIPKNWPAWNLEHYWNYPIDINHDEGVSISVIEIGPVFGTIQITRKLLDSEVIQKISLFNECPEVFMEYLTDWKKEKTLLKVLYSTTTNAEISTADIAYAAIDRKTKPEVPNDIARFEKIMHKYCDLSTPDKKWGLAILNEGKYAFDTEVDNESIRLTMLRSPDYPGPSGESWANLERKINREEFNHEVPKYSGLGPFKCRYALLPHQGGTLQINNSKESKANDIVKKKAEEFNQPVIIVPTEGIAENTKIFQLMDIKTPGVFIGTLKSNEWEKNGNIIARFIEGCGLQANAEILFNEEMANKIKGVKAVDILERPIDMEFQWNKENGSLKFEMGKFEICTFEFEL